MLEAWIGRNIFFAGQAFFRLLFGVPLGAADLVLDGMLLPLAAGPSFPAHERALSVAGAWQCLVFY